MTDRGAPHMTSHDPDWVLMPREPTREMLQAAFDSQQSATSALCRIIYRTMIASAPPPPSRDDRVASLQARVAELESERDEALAIKDEWRNSAVESGIKAAEAALAARAPGVGEIVPEGCTGSSLAFSTGVLHVNKDGSGYIAVDGDDFTLEDDRCEGPDGPEGSVHWIVRLPADEMLELRLFLNGSRAADAVKLREALEPFAAMHFGGSMYDGQPDDTNVLFHYASGAVVTLGDFRRARSALASLTKEKNDELP